MAEPPFFSEIFLSATSPSVTTSPYVVSPASVVQKSPDAVLGSGAVISVAVSAVNRTYGEPCDDRRLADAAVGGVEVIEGDGQRVVPADQRPSSPRRPCPSRACSRPGWPSRWWSSVGSPKAKPASVSPKLSGSGKTGCGSSPKTRPENQRLVGGIRPSASRVIGSSFGVFLTMSASSGSTCCLVKTSPPVPVGPEPGAGAGAGLAGGVQTAPGQTGRHRGGGQSGEQGAPAEPGAQRAGGVLDIVRRTFASPDAGQRHVPSVVSRCAVEPDSRR